MRRRGSGLSAIGVALALAATAAPAHGAATPALPLGFEPLGAGQFGARAPGGAATIAPGAAIVAGRHTAPVRLRPVGAHRPARTKAGRRLPGVVNRLTGDRSSWRTGIPMYADVRQNGIYRGIDLVFHTRKGALEYDFIVRPGASPRRVRLAVDGARRLRLSRSGDLVIHTRGGTLRQRRPVAYQRIGGRRKAVRARFVLRGKRRVAFRVGAYDRSRALVIDPVFAFSGYLGGSGYDEGYDVTTDTAGNAYVVGRTASFDFPALAGADVGCGTDPAGSCNADADYDEGRGDAFVAKLDPLGRLVWVTYIGGSTHDQAQDIALDPSGRIVVSGLTASRDFPVTAGAYRTTWPACDFECWSTYVLRLAPDGRSLDWSTLFASDTFDTDIEDLTVDAQGDVVLVGNTETSTFPATLGTLGAAARSLPDFWGDAFVTKLDSSGARLEWSGAFGGDDEDGAASVAIAPGGDIVIGGRTGSPDFFTTPGAPQPQCDGPRQPPNYEGCEMDGFVMRVPASGATPTYSTFLGGDGWDLISALALDADGRPLVAGRTTADDFPATRVLTLSPYERVFAARLPAAGGPPEWASLVAGGFSYVTGVAPGGSGSVYVSGSTYNADAVRPVSAYQSTHNGGLDGFVMRVNSGGASTRWATYLGGRGYDAVNGLAAGPRGVVVAGTTTSGDYPTRAADAALGDGTCRSPYGCPADAFVARITEATNTPPAYDAFSRRRVLEDAAGYAYGDATSATAEPGEPAHAGQPATHSLWFEWTAPANRTVTFDTRNSGFDTVVAVYRGKSFSLLTPVATNDNAPGRLTSRVSFTAVRGRTYRIAVDGKAGAAGLARLEWNGAPPANDDFLAAQPVTGTSGSVTGSVAYATMETDEPPDSDGDPVNSIWYRWTAPASGVYRLSTSGSDMPAAVEVFHGQRVELLEHLAWDILTARAGETYWFRVHPYNALAGDVKLSWRRVPRPANDDLAGARALTSESGTTTGETYAATAENDEPVHGTPSGGHSVWFRLAPPTPGTYALTLEKPDYGYSLYVYDGSSYATLVGISGGSRFVQLGFEAGESVLVAIDVFGEYRLSWRRLDAPANDLFSQAQVLAPGGGDEPVVTRNSSTQLGEPGGYTGVWFRWTAPSAGPVTFEVLDEVSAQGLNVFTGSSIRALTPVGFSDPYRAKVTFDATAGTTYRIRLAGGDVVRPLAWAIGRPANDDFGAARALTGANGTTSFSMAHATTEAGEPGNQWEGSAWFTWTAPSTARATFTTAAGRADLPIDIFSGNQLTALTAVAGSSYDQAVRGYVASFDAVAGRTYRIRVRGAWLGTQELTWNRAASESEAPFVAFAHYPSPGDHLRGTAYLEAITFDRRGVDRVEFLAGGTVVATSTLGYQGRFSANWDTRTRADGAVTMTARAVDRFGNIGLSAPVDVVVDNTAPQTQILSGPSAATASRSAKFTFSAGESVKEWWCRLDQSAWLPCGSTLTVAKLSDGLHKLEVRAKDFAGNLDVTPARWLWSVTGAEAQPIAAASSVEIAARSAIALDGEGRLQLAVALPRTRVTAEVLRRGLRVATGCSRACTIRARLQLVGARRRTLADTRMRARSGRKATVRLRVKRGLPADARLQLVVSAGAASVRRPLALDRPR